MLLIYPLFTKCNGVEFLSNIDLLERRTKPLKHWCVCSSVLDLITVMYCTAASPRDSRADCNHSRTPLLDIGLGRRKYITPVLRQLHWLPVRQRVLFKLATLVYCSLAGTAPAYLSDECHLTLPVEALLSALSWLPDLVVHTLITVIVVLPLPIIIYGTVCRCSFENRTFHSTALKLYWRRFCFKLRTSRHSATNHWRRRI